MKIGEFLAPADTLVDLRTSDKADVLRLLADHAAKAVHLPAEAILAAILKQEQLGSTGTGGGIAIPHARMTGLDKPFGALAQLHNGIGFDAIDAKPVDLVFLLLLPASAAKEQLAALASIARTLRKPPSLQRLRAARTSEDLHQAMTIDGDR